MDRSNRPEVLGELNPALRVPTLVLDDGRALGESGAILWYFGEGTRFVPEDRTSGRRCCSGCSSSSTTMSPRLRWCGSGWCTRVRPKSLPTGSSRVQATVRSRRWSVISRSGSSSSAVADAGRHGALRIHARRREAAFELAGYPAVCAGLTALSPRCRGTFRLTHEAWPRRVPTRGSVPLFSQLPGAVFAMLSSVTTKATREAGKRAKVETPWGRATVVEEVKLAQRAGQKRFTSVLQLLESASGERFVRIAYTTDGSVRRGPVTLRPRDLERLREAVRAARPECSARSRRWGLDERCARQASGIDERAENECTVR